jgi:hypothetical protein
MSNGIARIGGVVRNIFDMDASSVAAAKSAVERAVAEATPVKDVKSALVDFESGLGVAAFAKLGLGVLEADLDRDVRDAQTAARSGDMGRVLDEAAADNRRAAAGVEVRGPGREPYALFMRARGLDKRVSAGLVSRAEAIEMLGRDSALKDSLALALGRYQAALNAASDAVVADHAVETAARVRKEAHASVGRANMYDNQRRARVNGSDPTVLLEEFMASFPAILAKSVSEAMKAMNDAPLQRPFIEVDKAMNDAPLQRPFIEVDKDMNDAPLQRPFIEVDGEDA